MGRLVSSILPAAVMTAMGQPEGAVLTDAGVVGGTGELGSSLLTTAGGLGALGYAGTAPLVLSGSELANTGLSGLASTAPEAINAYTNAANIANTVDTANVPSMLGRDVGSFVGQGAPYTGGISNIPQAEINPYTGNVALNPQSPGVGVNLSNVAGQGISNAAVQQAIPAAESSLPYVGQDYLTQNLPKSAFDVGAQKGSGLFGGISDWWNGLTPFEKMMTQVGVGTGISMATRPSNSAYPTFGSKPVMAHTPDPNLRTAPVQRVFTPPAYPTYASGGIVAFAPGGQAMSSSPLDGKAMGANQNQMYPQSQQEHTYFATPTQMPTSAEVVGSDYDPKTDAYTGMVTQPMASGGIAHYATGSTTTTEVQDPTDSYDIFKNVHDTLHPANKAKDFSTKMPDVGIYHDTDTDTRNVLNPAKAWAIRQNKQNIIAGMPKGIPGQESRLVALQNTPELGSIDLTPAQNPLIEAQQQAKQAASGGIVGYSLGGYASGGNPRLLKGPGDGMSDNIPATIADRQPARLADGEFVVPADVVSHLGNGSTDAGAKKLHTMMDKVRVARTGKKAQGTQINPNKYLPS